MNREIKAGLAWSGGIIGLALAATLARRLGYVSADTVTRIVVGTNGLLIVYYGNRMPKGIVPNPRARHALLVGGYATVLSGLIYAGLFAFAPLSVAVSLGIVAVVSGIAVTFGYCLWQRAWMKTV